ncbi:MAG: bifunctional hydroxymethylpyrimidine kinase/phosphomethylpyrimidine kinase [Candidatus Cloacimonetes bacterium]|nr:bifunctional hydroxymethylpyrimidine kinase/phosphomethylpyrimidine kinase [Candidatus Cloacimonadota bacterium]MBL7148954.1 bifunctional hydroxymethylpyrimidine kinase/phosphomethylpyrimidine kinase [Candidatus Cloacimonadota bacterium]
MTDLLQIVNLFPHGKIAVIGDLMLDKYIIGQVERISPEAPIPIVSVRQELWALGGAANVAANISTLDGDAYLLGVLGDDASGETFFSLARQKGIDTEGIHVDAQKTTIQKIRVIGQNQQLLRIDYENTDYIEENISEMFLSQLSKNSKLAAIIVSDYAKGTISGKLMHELKLFSKAYNIKLIIDPKPGHKDFYKDIDLVTPNLKEAQLMSGIVVSSRESLEKCGTKIMEELSCSVVITTGDKGMSVFQMNKKPVHISTKATEVFDVSGAGDTVVATISMALISGATLTQAAEIANFAAGLKVRKVGTAPVYLDELKQAISS